MKTKSHAVIGLSAAIVLGETCMANGWIEGTNTVQLLITFGSMLQFVAGSLYPNFEQDYDPLVDSAETSWASRVVNYENDGRNIGHSLFNALFSTVVPFGILFLITSLLHWHTTWVLFMAGGFFAGQILHLILDSLSGYVRWFLPLCKVKIGLPILCTDALENIGTVIISAACLLYATYRIAGSFI